MKKQPWEMSVAELDEEIRKNGELLREGNGSASYLLLLHREREERLIEDEIIERSEFAKTVMGLAHKPLPD